MCKVLVSCRVAVVFYDSISSHPYSAGAEHVGIPTNRRGAVPKGLPTHKATTTKPSPPGSDTFTFGTRRPSVDSFTRAIYENLRCREDFAMCCRKNMVPPWQQHFVRVSPSKPDSTKTAGRTCCRNKPVPTRRHARTIKKQTPPATTK